MTEGSLRIAQVAPLYESVPPQLYGGTERVVSWLTEELVGLGHDVTLFASGDSKTSGHLVPVCPISLWRDPNVRETLPQHVRMLELVFRDQSRFDVIHFHCDYIHFPLVRRLPCPNVSTLHGLIHLHDLEELFAEYRELPLVSISDAQRRPLPAANWRATVYHGLPRNLHKFQPSAGKYLAFLGRTSPEKRLDRAIEIARGAGMPLKVAAKIYDEDQVYFQSTIAPLLEKSRSFVEFLGEIGGERKNEFLRGASALLFPIDWAEPFGLVMIEALACGTPVIGWRNGSVPEIIEHGVTGFVIDSVESGIVCARQISEVDRADCRRAFEERFDSRRMARDYVTRVSAFDCRFGDPCRHADSMGRSLCATVQMTGTQSGVQERGVLSKGWTDDAHYILADSSLTDGRIRVLKHGDTFAVFDHYGNIKPVKTGEEGIYHDGTRFVSCLTLEIEGISPFFLSSTVRDDNDQLTVALTNPALRCENLDHLPLGSLHIAKRVFLWHGACYQEMTVENHSRQRVATSLRIRYAADYADIFEIRGMARKARGDDLPPSVEDSTLVLSYRGLDQVERRTHFEFSQAAEISANAALFELSLEPRDVTRLYVTARCERVGTAAPRRLKFDHARAQALDEIRNRKADACTMYGSNGQFNAWVNRAISDLHMMTTALSDRSLSLCRRAVVQHSVRS